MSQQQPGLYQGLVWFLQGLNVSVTARVISRFGLVLLELNVSSTGRVISRFGWVLLGLNFSSTARVISRFGLVLLGLNVSATARVISRFGLVLLGLNVSVTTRVISRFGPPLGNPDPHVWCLLLASDLWAGADPGGGGQGGLAPWIPPKTLTNMNLCD